MANRSLTLFAIALIGVLAAIDGASAQTGSETRELRLAQEEVRNREQQLAQAREALESAAQEVARLSSELGGSFVRNFTREFRGPGRRVLLGVNIEDADRGVRVVGVSPGGAADDAGVETGDVILALDGAELTAAGNRSASELLVAQLGNVEPGETVTLRVLRDGEELDVDVETREDERAGYFFAGPGRGMAVPVAPGTNFDIRTFFDPVGRWRGMQLVPLSEELGRYFGTAEGLLVVSAPDNDALGLVDGDVILEIGGRTPTGPEHAMRILRSFEVGETLRLTIMRNQRRENLEMELPPPGRSG